MGFFDFLQGGQTPPQTPPSAEGAFGNSFQFMQNQAPPEVAQLQQAPKTPQDQQESLSAWQRITDKVRNDPNLQRSLLHASQYLRNGGSLSGAVNYGWGAYDMYNQASDDAQRGEEKWALDKQAKQAEIGQTQAQTQQTQVNTNKANLEIDEFVKNADNRVREIRMKLEKGEIDLDSAKLAREREFLARDAARRMEKFRQEHPELDAIAMSVQLQKPIAEYDKLISEIDKNQSSVTENMANARLKDRTDPNIRAGSGSGSGDGSEGNEYTGMADSILKRWNSLPEAKRKKYGSIDEFIVQDYTVSLGKSASGVLSEVKRLQGTPSTGSGKVINLDSLDTAPPQQAILPPPAPPQSPYAQSPYAGQGRVDLKLGKPQEPYYPPYSQQRR